jgi:hypothetical protein
VRTLPLVPDGCTLSPEGLDLQLGRAARLAPAVADVRRSEDEVSVSFGQGVDRALVDELVETERGCCSFLAIDYDGDARVLRVASPDARGRDVVARVASAFAGEVR